MKSLYIISAVYLIWITYFPAFSQEKESVKTGYEIKGSIADVPDNTKLFLIRDDNGNADTVEVVETEGGHFEFKGKLSQEGEFHYVKLDTTMVKLTPNRQSYVTLLLGNSNIKIGGVLNDWPSVKIEGSQATQDYTDCIQYVNEARKALIQAYESGTDSISRSIADKNYKKAIADYITKHPGSMFNPSLILRTEKPLGFEMMQTFYNELPARSRESYYGEKLRDRLEFLKKEKEVATGISASGKGILVGDIAPDFNGYTPEGKDLSLKMVVEKSKLTLVDFWASWCKPCREENPNVKRIYNEYHDKGFNVLSVSIDKREGDWKRAIMEDKLPWYHISDMRNGNSLIASLFKVYKVPTTYLIDESGKIIATEIRGEKLEEIVRERLSK